MQNSTRTAQAASFLARVASALLLAAAFAFFATAPAHACLGGGAACDAFSDCCGGACSNAFGGTCPTCKTGRQACSGLGRGNCCDGLQCDFLGECRHVPSHTGELCGAGVPCKDSTDTCQPAGGLTSRCVACRTSLQSCSGLGQGTCCPGMLCDVTGVCRSDPPTLGEPCGAGVPCDSPYICDAAVGGTCIACGNGTDDCTGLGRGTCCDGLLCDVVGECRHTPGKEGEVCGVGVGCEDPLECSSLVGGRCQTCGAPADACFGLGRGTCCDGLVCDVTGECRHPKPHLGEPCGLGVACADDQGVCNALTGGRCVEFKPETCDRLFPDCGEGEVCDFWCGECRAERPREGEACGLDGLFGPQCEAGLTCRDSFPCGRCEAEKGLGQRCFGTTNCQDGLQCWPFEQVCYPEGGEGLFPPEFCLGIYSPEKHQSAMALDATVSFGLAAIAGAGLTATVELGGVYGQDGSYGCYITRCNGIEVSAGISDAACLGVYNTYGDFAGVATNIAESAGVGEFAQFATSQVLNGDGAFIGTTNCFSLGVGVSPPITAGVYQCETIVETMLEPLSTTAPTNIDGDADGNGSASATDALVSLRSAVRAGIRCPDCVCDLNGDAQVTATDSLLNLQLAVDLEPDINRQPCQVSHPTTTTTTLEPMSLREQLERKRALLEAEAGFR